MDKKIMIAIAAVVVIALAYLFVSGAITLSNTSSIKSSDQAQNTAVNISSNIEGLSSTLTSIDNSLGQQ